MKAQQVEDQMRRVHHFVFDDESGMRSDYVENIGHVWLALTHYTNGCNWSYLSTTGARLQGRT